MIWTEEQKNHMQWLRENGHSNDDIAHNFGVTAKRPGDVIRKVLARFIAGKMRAGTACLEAARQEGGEIGRLAGNGPATLPERGDGLTRLHDEFDAKVPERAASRPKWAGRPPLRIMPKDFQR